jgi:putative photosynthetic complex assembly protein
MQHQHTQIPRAAVVGAGVLVAFSILAAAAGRLSGIGVTTLAPGRALQVQALRFEDGARGGVRVVDAGSGRVVDRIEPGKDGFLRGVLRGFARARRLEGIGKEPPFVLTRWADGRLSLHDPSTGRSVALEAFGPTNAAAFARLMPAPGGEGSLPRPDSTTIQGFAPDAGAHHEHDNG